MQTVTGKSGAGNGKLPDIAASSLPDTLAALHVDPDTGLTRDDVDIRRKEHGYNEVAVIKRQPALKFPRKFWGTSAWMLELIMVLSAVLGKYLDLDDGEAHLRIEGAGLVIQSVRFWHLSMPTTEKVSKLPGLWYGVLCHDSVN